jgi:hypothetical protein
VRSWPGHFRIWPTQVVHNSDAGSADSPDMANSVGNVGRRPGVEHNEDEARSPSPAPPPFRREYPLSPSSARDRGHDAALVDFVRNSTPPAAPSRANDRILYIGVNPESAGTEAAALRRIRPDTKVITPASGDVIAHRGASHDLSMESGRRAFVASVGLRGPTADRVVDVLAQASEGQRATLGQMAALFATAEQGASIPSRLVLSGHSFGGGSVAGGGNELSFPDVQKLGKAMPAAARQIEDIHLSGCFTHGNARNDNAVWQQAFPNMKTIWAYDGFAPSAPVHHLEAWQAATKGRTENLAPQPWLRDQGVACWSVKSGYVDKDVSPEVLERAKRAADADFDRLMAGSPRITSAQDQPAARHYDTYASLSKRPERNDVPEMDRRATQLLALRHYETDVRERFGAEYRSEIGAGFHAVGLEPPSFESLTRAEALATSREFQVALARMPGPSEAATRLATLLRGLDTFDPLVVDPRWSTHAR